MRVMHDAFSETALFGYVTGGQNSDVSIGKKTKHLKEQMDCKSYKT